MSPGGRKNRLRIRKTWAHSCNIVHTMGLPSFFLNEERICLALSLSLCLVVVLIHLPPPCIIDPLARVVSTSLDYSPRKHTTSLNIFWLLKLNSSNLSILHSSSTRPNKLYPTEIIYAVHSFEKGQVLQLYEYEGSKESRVRLTSLLMRRNRSDC